MTESRVLLDTAAFMDSPQAISIQDCPTKDIRTIVQRFLSACYTGLGKAPRLMDGDDVILLLGEILPRHYGARDPLAAATPSVLQAYREFLQDSALVPEAFEMNRAFEAHESSFGEAVASGVAHREGIAVTSKADTRVFRGDKVGRNDPCPCGSGQKFKKCCQRLGDS